MHLRYLFIVPLLTFVILFAGCGNDPYCPAGKSWCWAQCVDLISDEDNCGSCDNACGSSQSCIEGSCGCQEGYTDCGGSCVDLQFDFENCGSCGQECCHAEACVNGNCELGCPQGLAGCHDGECGFCANLTNDEANCGACNNPCREDQVCNNSSCTCFGSLQECDGECVDLNTDVENCGSCGNLCPPNEPCVNGACTNGGCHPPMLQCGMDCVNPLTDNDHCSQCDNPCNTVNGFTCQGGNCLCLIGEECVTGVCSDLNTDESNCGSCGVICQRDNAAARCQVGICRIGQCDSLWDDCNGVDEDGCETSLETLDNCGGCMVPCSHPGPRECECTGGVCRCPSCFADCDGNVSNGDETYVCDDVNNCGWCANVCTVENGTPWCDLGVCSISSCDNGYGDCDQSYNTGCEADLMIDPNNCGLCDIVCDTGESCVDGVCQ